MLHWRPRGRIGRLIAEESFIASDTVTLINNGCGVTNAVVQGHLLRFASDKASVVRVLDKYPFRSKHRVWNDQLQVDLTMSSVDWMTADGRDPISRPLFGRAAFDENDNDHQLAKKRCLIILRRTLKVGINYGLCTCGDCRESDGLRWAVLMKPNLEGVGRALLDGCLPSDQLPCASCEHDDHLGNQPCYRSYVFQNIESKEADVC